MNDVEAFLELYGLAAIFVVMLVKGIGVPIPIPADAIMLATSARVASGRMILWQAFLAILIASMIGGLIQFILVRGPGRSFLYRYGHYLGVTPPRIDAASARLKGGNIFTIGVAILTPGVRSVAIPAAGIAGIPLQRFLGGLLVGSATFLALHFLIGLAGGTLLNTVGSIVPLPVVIGGIIGLLLVGLGVWYVIHRRQMPHASNVEVLKQAVGSWNEATCPVCLCLGAVERLQLQTAEHRAVS
jgi:membrane protein DedA with SNARE-associated domain